MILKLGSKGKNVGKIQKFLGIKVDNDFGPKTNQALKIWQLKNKLVADGICGPKTLKKMGISLSEEEVKDEIGIGHINYANNLHSLSKLKNVIPASVLDQIPETAVKFGIQNNLQLAHFLSQCAHESGNFSLVRENMNYSAKRLLQVFGKYFTDQQAAQYANQPERIGARVYANRMGNGNEKSKDGYEYRGRGYIQLTGKANYAAFSEMIGENVVEHPDLVATKYPLASAAFFFNHNNLWGICNHGATDADVKTLTKRVNGGIHGLSSRIAYFRKFSQLLS